VDKVSHVTLRNSTAIVVTAEATLAALSVATLKCERPLSRKSKSLILVDFVENLRTLAGRIFGYLF